MARGKTFSITVPYRMVDEYDKKAKELKVSRSKVIFNILLNSWNSEYPDTQIINCINAKGTFCTEYEKECDKDIDDCILQIPIEEDE